MPALLSTRPAPAPPPAEVIASTAGLPIQLTRLIGREREIASLQELLASTRLLTLTGAGGSGKTRLALEVAARSAGTFSDGVAWVELAPISDPALVPDQVAAALGVGETAGRPMVEALRHALAPRSLLLVLDNCEHLIETCANLAETFLREAPALKILATSREALGIPGEIAWIVPPLILPEAHGPLTAEAVSRSEAAQLFLERARSVAPSFEITDANAPAVAQVCRRLDGIPLAIELAAARTRVLVPEQIAERLGNAFGLLTSGSRTALPRHRTLRAVIDWSYELLLEKKKVLLRRLSLFSGGFTIEAAEAVCAGGEIEEFEVLDLLAQLVDRSMVVMREQEGSARYHLLETVRQYAEERLRDSRVDGDGAAAAEMELLQRRHALHFAELTEQAATQLHGAAQLKRLAQLDAEHDNLRAALRWSLTRGEVEIAMRLCAALRDFWRIRGHLTEGRRWMEEALGSGTAASTPDVLRAYVLVGAGVLARMQADHELFRLRLVEGEALARALGDPAALADVLTQLGVHLRDLGDLSAARVHLEQAVSLWRAAGDAWGLTLALGIRAAIAHAEGDIAHARALRLEAAVISRQAGDREGEARALIGLGEVARLEGNLAGARAYYERSMVLFRELRDTWHIAAILHNLGWVATEAGQHDEACQAFAESASLFRSAGNPVGLALCLAGLARILYETGDPISAAVALGSAWPQLERPGIAPAHADIRACEQIRAAVEAALDQDAFACAWAQGTARDAADHTADVLGHLGSGARKRTGAPEDIPSPATPDPGDGIRTQPRPLVEGSPAPALRVLALGPLHIYRRGELLPPEAWGSAKPRELLLFLLAHPEGCTKEQVGLALWPEASPTQLRNNFHTTLHRLRKALGEGEWISLAGDRYRIASEPGYEFDAAIFEREATATLREHRTGGEARERLQAALALYRGDFLEGEVIGDWHLEERDRLRQLYVAGMLARGESLFGAGNYAEAAEVYRRVILREELSEEAHRRLMLCHARLGERAQALRLYQRLCELLREELDTEPDEETSALFERLQRGEIP